MKRSLLAFGAVMTLAGTLAGTTRTALAQPPELPSLSGEGDAPPQAAPGAGNAANLSPQQMYEHVRRGVVAIQRNGVPSAIGTVLSGDGRILTSLSGLTGAQGADVRYADGTTVHARLDRADKTLDLALLAPDPVHSRDGLTASEADPSGVDVRAMLPAHGALLGPVLASFKGPADAHARGGEPLFQMLNVDVQGAPVAGAPVLDPTGAVVAVLVRGCRNLAGAHEGSAAPDASKGVCQPVVLGAPVSAIRTFLAPLAPTLRAAAAGRTGHGSEGGPAGASPAPGVEPSPTADPAPTPTFGHPSPFLGVRVEPHVSGAVHGVRVAAVAPGGPADQAGLKPSADVIVAVDGQPVASSEALGAAIGKHAPGETASLLVYGGGSFRQVAVTLRASP